MVKIKNVPKSLKCKINTTIFLDTGFPKGGGGGGGAGRFGKNSQKKSFFFFESVPNRFFTVFFMTSLIKCLKGQVSVFCWACQRGIVKNNNWKSGRNWLRLVIFTRAHLSQSRFLMLDLGKPVMNETIHLWNCQAFQVSVCRLNQVGSHYLPSARIVASFCEILYLHLICTGQLSTSPIQGERRSDGKKEQICNFQMNLHLNVNTPRPLPQWAKSHTHTLTLYTVHHARKYNQLSDQQQI